MSMDALVKVGERELWECEEVSSKVGRLPSKLQEPFLRSATQMAEQESDSMLKFIRESRMALRLTSMEIQEEQQAMQRTSRFMGKNKAQSHFEETGMGRRPPTRSDMSTYNKPQTEQDSQRAAVERYIRKRELEREKSRMYLGDDDDDDDLPAAGTAAPGLYQEEAREAVNNMRVSSARIENERVRQSEIVRQRKEKKKAAKEEKAFELLSQATSTEFAKKKDKERQAEKVKELLEEKKRRRENTMLSLGGRTDTFLASDVSDSRAGTLTPIGDDTVSKKKDKEKKKKDKKKDKDLDEEGEEEDKEKKKKKKKKKREAETVIDLA